MTQHAEKTVFNNLDALELPQKIQLINACTGIKPANLLGSQNANGQTNLALFSSVVHLGSNPPLIGLVLRPDNGHRHSYQNMLQTGVYSLNAVDAVWSDKAHHTAANFLIEQSEFEQVGLSTHYYPNFAAPFVAESPLHIGLKFVQEIPIPLNQTRLLIGEVQLLAVNQNALDSEGRINLQTLNISGISGLDSYYQLQRSALYPMPKTDEKPNNLLNA
ncbi:MAG: flavin reductase [Thiotrichales bacterium]|nr:flavin reductase [Thiotrichales bacterium]